MLEYNDRICTSSSSYSHLEEKNHKSLSVHHEQRTQTLRDKTEIFETNYAARKKHLSVGAISHGREVVLKHSWLQANV